MTTKSNVPFCFDHMKLFWFSGLVIHHGNKFLKQLSPIKLENSFRYHKCYYLFLSFGFTFFSVKFCCKKGWSYIFNFRTIYLVCLCFAGYNESVQRESNFILFCIFNYVPYIKPHPPFLILLLVNFGLPGENLVTSTIWFATKA